MILRIEIGLKIVLFEVDFFLFAIGDKKNS